jgi:hypothetical protein
MDNLYNQRINMANKIRSDINHSNTSFPTSVKLFIICNIKFDSGKILQEQRIGIRAVELSKWINIIIINYCYYYCYINYPVLYFIYKCIVVVSYFLLVLTL